MATRVSVAVDGRELSLSNLDKLLYPAAGFRKADVVDYYRRIAPVLLPHLAGRPPTLVRAPDGAQGERFFEKRCPPHHPSWVRASEPLEPNGGQRSACGETQAPHSAAAWWSISRHSCGSRISPRSSCTRTSGSCPT